MLPKELFKAVKHLEIVARRAVNDQLAGQYHSVFKGRGMDFLDVRAYQPGDDIRVIDWNVSARMNELHVKQYVEERELTVFLIVDVSGSQTFGTHHRRKLETAAQLAALIAFSAIKNNDQVGLLTFTDRIETFLPPKKGRKHVLRVIREVLAPQAAGRGTKLQLALEHFTRMTKKRAVVFVISDFIDENFEQSLKIANRRHEMIPIVIIDPMEQRLPDMGIVHFEDPETGEVIPVDTSSAAVRDAYEAHMAQRHAGRDKLFNRLKLDNVKIHTERDHIDPLVHYFRRRSRGAR
jgi:uncharacterized protein (DUF58 family)